MGNKEFSTNKGIKILEAIRACPIDVDSLKELALSYGGLINADYRRLVWPKLLGISNETSEDPKTYITLHKDEYQIDLDIERSLKNYNVTVSMKNNKINELRIYLKEILLGMICYDSNFHYYQGMHDIASVLLLVSGRKVGFSMMKQLMYSYFNDFSTSTCFSLEGLETINIIIHHYSPELFFFLNSISEQLAFCLSWVITWFSHDIYKVECVERLYDLLLSCHPFMIFYFISTLIISVKDELMKIEQSLAALHTYFAKPKVLNSLSKIESLITQTVNNYNNYLPSEILSIKSSLKSLKMISKYPYDYMNEDVYADKNKKYGRKDNNNPPPLKEEEKSIFEKMNSIITGTTIVMSVLIGYFSTH